MDQFINSGIERYRQQIHKRMKIWPLNRSRSTTICEKKRIQTKTCAISQRRKEQKKWIKRKMYDDFGRCTDSRYFNARKKSHKKKKYILCDTKSNAVKADNTTRSIDSDIQQHQWQIQKTQTKDSYNKPLSRSDVI